MPIWPSKVSSICCGIFILFSVQLFGIYTYYVYENEPIPTLCIQLSPFRIQVLTEYVNTMINPLPSNVSREVMLYSLREASRMHYSWIMYQSCRFFSHKMVISIQKYWSSFLSNTAQSRSLVLGATDPVETTYRRSWLVEGGKHFLLTKTCSAINRWCTFSCFLLFSLDLSLNVSTTSSIWKTAGD